jgi:thioredoxin reductase
VAIAGLRDGPDGVPSHASVVSAYGGAQHLGPAQGWTSRAAVERNVRVVLGAGLVKSSIQGNRARVGFVMGDGTQRAIDADHVIAATGFQVDMRRLLFISPTLMDRLTLADKTPVLSPYFETSVPGLFTVGVLAANSFGPLLRFAYGAGFASRRLSAFLTRTAVRHLVPATAKLVSA